MLSGSMSIKAARKTLVKLTPGWPDSDQIKNNFIEKNFGYSFVLFCWIYLNW